MRRLLTGCVLGMVLLCAACAGTGTAGGAGDGPSAAPDLTAEGDRLAAELRALDDVTAAEVQVRSGTTWGRQVVIDASTASADGEDQRAALEHAVRAGWNTTAFVPTDVSATLAGPGGVHLDARDLGFAHQGADPAGLFERFGPPAADEDWEP